MATKKFLFIAKFSDTCDDIIPFFSFLVFFSFNYIIVIGRKGLREGARGEKIQKEPQLPPFFRNIKQVDLFMYICHRTAQFLKAFFQLFK